MSKNRGTLSGLKVLDLSRVLAGPWATQLFADLGATVWKIEKPLVGDDTRNWGEALSPRESDDIGSSGSKTSAYFLSTNRGKHSLAIDIKSAKGQNIIQELAKQADIFIENFKRGDLAKYGLDYKKLSQINPNLIYCSITGFGQTGPYADQAGYDAMIQASAGLMSITGEKDGAPQKTGVAVSDIMTGMYASTAILAAIYNRDKSGKGQHIDLSLFDTQVGWLANQGMSYLTTGQVPIKQGSVHPNIAPYQPIKCQDRSILLAVGNDRQFKDCCNTLGLSSLSRDPRFTNNNQRVKNRPELIEKLEAVFTTKPSAFWLEKLADVNVPCSPINDLKQVFEHPQIEARDTIFELTHSNLGKIPQIANPIKYSTTPIQYNKAPPELGEDTEEVLKKELSFSEQEYSELLKLGVIG